MSRAWCLGRPKPCECLFRGPQPTPDARGRRGLGQRPTTHLPSALSKRTRVFAGAKGISQLLSTLVGVGALPTTPFLGRREFKVAPTSESQRTPLPTPRHGSAAGAHVACYRHCPGDCEWRIMPSPF